MSWKYKKKCKNHTVPPYKKTVLNKDEEYPTAHKTRSDPARLKDSSHTLHLVELLKPANIKLVQNTVHNHTQKKDGSLGKQRS